MGGEGEREDKRIKGEGERGRGRKRENWKRMDLFPVLKKAN